jgi:hypothetical protein
MPRTCLACSSPGEKRLKAVTLTPIGTTSRSASLKPGSLTHHESLRSRQRSKRITRIVIPMAPATTIEIEPG